MNADDLTLRAKYGMDRPVDRNHPIIGTTQVIERTSGLVTRETGDTGWLFDPCWSPAMWQLDKRTVRDMRQRFAERIEAAPESATFLYYPCIPELYVYSDGMERFSYMITTRVPMPHAVGERGCDIRLAPNGCDGRAVYLPREHAPFITVYSVCRACDVWARQTAEIRFRSNVIGAQVNLPPGATIDPGSPIPPGL